MGHAKETFEAMLDPAQSGETLFGLGMALWWLGRDRALSSPLGTRVRRVPWLRGSAA